MVHVWCLSVLFERVLTTTIQLHSKVLNCSYAHEVFKNISLVGFEHRGHGHHLDPSLLHVNTRGSYSPVASPRYYWSSVRASLSPKSSLWYCPRLFEISHSPAMHFFGGRPWSLGSCLMTIYSSAIIQNRTPYVAYRDKYLCLNIRLFWLSDSRTGRVETEVLGGSR